MRRGRRRETPGEMEFQDTAATAGVGCPNCGRGFNCEGPPDCWCLKVERNFDWEDFIIRTGNSSCVCPVCLTGKTEPGIEAGA
jgi:hypothetical protein